jgi:hypothetical protein
MDKLKLNIVELIDDGHTLESSTELQALIGESEELKKFYADLLRSENQLEDFINQAGVAEVQADLKDLIDQELGLKETKQTFNIQRYLPFAIAAGFVLFAFNFFMPMGQEDVFTPATEETFALAEPEISEPEVIGEPNAVYVVSLQEGETLWSKSNEIAEILDVSRFQVMHALYEVNKDSFANQDINAYPPELTLDEEFVFAVSQSEARSTVKRRMACRC